MGGLRRRWHLNRIARSSFLEFDSKSRTYPSANFMTSTMIPSSRKALLKKTHVLKELRTPHSVGEKLLKSAGLGLVRGGLALVQPAQAEPEAPVESKSNRMSYSRFLEYLDEGAVKKVDLFENGTVAIAEIFNPAFNKIQRVKIQLPGLPQDLLRKFNEKDVAFAAHPMEVNMGAVLLDLLGNLAFPLILLGSLLLRGAASNSPGGPNLPFGLGRTKAKFKMEPNTGVTFDDVAGVDEAKQDFEEIVEFLKSPEKFAAIGARIPKVQKSLLSFFIVYPFKHTNRTSSLSSPYPLPLPVA